MGLKVKSLEEHFKPKDYDKIRIKEMGNIVELMYTERKNHQILIKKISDKEYIDLRTGEVKQCNSINNRADNLNSVRQSLGRLRDLLNTNITDVKKCRWVTLTYAENMTDSKRLYKDFDKFNKRMKYALSKDGHKYEYIVCMEPQGRGAWHAHLLYIWQNKAPYIPNQELADLWQQGFVKIKKLDDVDNVGAYLTAYLGDMEITEIDNLKSSQYQLKTVEIEENGEKVKKSYIKGARLELYPANFQMIRHSKGIKQPTETYMSLEDAKKKVLGATKTFESSVKISDDNGFSNVISKAYYNSKRKEIQ